MTVKTIKQNMRLSVISLTKQQCEKTITKMFFLNQFSLPLPYFDGRSTQHTNSETKQRRNTQLKVLKKITTQLGGGLLKINNSLSILVQPTQQISQRGDRDRFVFGLFSSFLLSRRPMDLIVRHHVRYYGSRWQPTQIRILRMITKRGSNVSKSNN